MAWDSPGAHKIVTAMNDSLTSTLSMTAHDDASWAACPMVRAIVCVLSRSRVTVSNPAIDRSGVFRIIFGGQALRIEADCFGILIRPATHGHRMCGS